MSPELLFWPALLTALLIAACVSDVHARRIPNGIVVAVLAAGVIRAAVAAGAHAPGVGAAWLGVGLGLAAWLPLYAIGMLGAGDVKLFAAAGAWLGPHGVLPATIYAALAGGVLAAVWVARRAVTSSSPRDARLPYGLAVATGVLIVAWSPG